MKVREERVDVHVEELGIFFIEVVNNQIPSVGHHAENEVFLEAFIPRTAGRPLMDGRAALASK